MNKEVTQETELLDAEGQMTVPGWARKPLWNYNRETVSSKLRLKEWDYYCILSGTSGLSLTISDMGYLGFVGITILDFTTKTEISRSLILPFPLGKWNLPRTSINGITTFHNKTANIMFSAEAGKRKLTFLWKNFLKGKDLSGELDLYRNPESDTIVVATPFKKNRKAFYYNQKINCLSSTGYYQLGTDKTTFNPDSTFGVLDWGRGIWTYENTWYWSSASGMVKGIPFGFNLGYGFGDLSTHSENALFYNGVLHKLDKLTFEIPDTGYLTPWHLFDNEGRFEMKFIPILDRSSKTNLLLIKSDQHQIFGKFYGKAILDDGTILEIQDLTGFAEKVFNRW